MAQFCPYEKRKCSECQHCKWDEDYGGKACFVKQDLTKEEYESGQIKMMLKVKEKQGGK